MGYSAKKIEFVARGALRAELCVRHHDCSWRLANPGLTPAARSVLSPYLNRHMVKNTPYAAWYTDLKTEGRREQRALSLEVGGDQTL
jgi:hypothetical protein